MARFFVLLRRQPVSSVLVLWIMFTLCGCAVPHHPILGDRFIDTKSVRDSTYLFRLHDSPLLQSGNPRLARKADLAGLQIKSVQLKNLGREPIVIGKTHGFYVSDSLIALVPPGEFYKDLQQIVFASAIYVMLLPVTKTVVLESRNEARTYPIGFVLAPLATTITAIAMRNANKALEAELFSADMANRVIEPGATVSGLVYYRHKSKTAGLSFKPLAR